MNKKKLIVIIVAAALAVAVAVGLIVYFVAEKNIGESSYGEVYGVDVISETELSVRCSAPYYAFGNDYQIDKPISATVSYDDNAEEKTIGGKISELKYEKSKTDEFKMGELTFTIKLYKELKDSKNYHLVIKENAVSSKKDDYKNKELTFDFSYTVSDDGSYSSNEESYYNAKTEKLENMNAYFKETDKKHYIVITGDVENATVFSEDAAKNAKVFALVNYVNGGYHGTFALKDMKVSVKDNKLTVEAAVDDERVIAGQEYTVRLTEGFLKSKDGKTVSEDSQCLFTYVK